MARERQLFPLMLSVAEVAAHVGIERRVVYSWIEHGLPIYRVGVRRKVLVADLIEFLRMHLKRE